MKVSWFFPLFTLGLSPAYGSVSVISKVRCEIDFPFDSSVANVTQLDACLQKMKGSTVLPDHIAIYASASPPGSPSYNFELSKRRSRAISQVMRDQFPKAEQEFFPGGVNPAYGQKAVVVASISSSEPIILREKAGANTDDSFLRLNRVGLVLGAHTLRDSNAHYQALGAGAAARTKPILGLPFELGTDLESLRAEDYYDQYAFNLDAGPVFSWRALHLAPKIVLRQLWSGEGTNATDFGFRVQTGLRLDYWTFALSAGASQESKEGLGTIARSF